MQVGIYYREISSTLHAFCLKEAQVLSERYKMPEELERLYYNILGALYFEGGN